MTAASVHAPSPAPWPRAAVAGTPVWRFANESGPDADGHEWLLKRNCSMSPAQMFAIYLSLCAISLGIALGFSWNGASPILAFAGIELLLVSVALLVYARHAADHERIALSRGALTVTHRHGRLVEHTEFRAAWVRVEPAAGDGSLVELSGDGQRARVGRYLRPEWRAALARELRAALRTHTLIADLKQR